VVRTKQKMKRIPLSVEQERAIWRRYWSYRLPKPNSTSFKRDKPKDEEELKWFVYCHQLLNNEKHLNLKCKEQ
jgi:hypothetical protein